jgi:hypothetical protein
MADRTRTWWAALAALTCLVVLAASCSSGSGTTELSNDAADRTTEGPLPTAPPVKGSGAGTSGTVDVNELIRRIDDLNNETDLCKLLTGEAYQAIAGSDVNLTSLLTNPSGFTQLFTSLDRLFGHMVTIAPTSIQPAVTTMQGMWKQMSTYDPRASDAETKLKAVIADPKVQSAQSELGAYVQSSCATSTTTP